MTDNDYRRIMATADSIGYEAATSINPTPMHVVGHNHRTGEEKHYVVDDGMCGFAWVSIPGNTGLARYCRKHDIGHKGYPKGWHIWISAHGQSYERKQAHARAMADYLRSVFDFPIYAQARLD